MLLPLLLSVAISMPFSPHYATDPGENHTTVLPAEAIPQSAGGWLPTPGPPTVAVLKSLLLSGRTPGDVIVGVTLEKDSVEAPRKFPLVGMARVWNLTYEFRIVGPDGPYAVYVDRTALIREGK